MILSEGLQNLGQSTGIYNMILSADPSITSPVEQFMHQFGHPIMLVICLFLMWLGIKKQFEPLLLVPIAFGGFLSNIPVCDIAGAHGFLGIIYEAGIHQGLFPLIIFMGVCNCHSHSHMENTRRHFRARVRSSAVRFNKLVLLVSSVVLMVQHQFSLHQN